MTRLLLVLLALAAFLAYLLHRILAGDDRVWLPPCEDELDWMGGEWDW